LKSHIEIGKELQVKDQQRAIFEMMQNIVFNVEHKHQVGVRTRHDNFMNRDVAVGPVYNTDFWAVETYDECKSKLAAYPQFSAEFRSFLDRIKSSPNNGVQVPMGPPNDAPALFCPPQWEQQAFGPLDFRIGRQ
jgi:hypothetical protein